MSDTPRTEKYGGTWASTPSNGITIYEHARNLEREADKLAKQCVKNVEEIGELRAALVISEKKELATRAVIKSWKEDEGADAARLAWLVEFGYKGLVDLADQNIFITREDIDAAMEAHNNE